MNDAAITSTEAKACIRLIGFVGPHDLSKAELTAFAAFMCKLEKIAGTSTLTIADVEAIHRFAWEHGRGWKAALRAEWMRACERLTSDSWLQDEKRWIPYQGVLQRLRNREDFGTRGLERFKLPKGFKFKGKR